MRQTFSTRLHFPRFGRRLVGSYLKALSASLIGSSFSNEVPELPRFLVCSTGVRKPSANDIGSRSAGQGQKDLFKVFFLSDNV